MAIELCRYYLTGRHFTVVTNHASLTWLRNFREPEGMVARWIARLQPFNFAIVHRPGKHHSHADGLSRRTSRPCKRETCFESKPLRKEATSKTEMARCYTPAFPYQRHFDGYVKMSEEDAALFWEIGNHLAPDPGGSSVGTALPDRAIPITEETAPETTISPRPVPDDRPDDPRGTDVCTRPMVTARTLSLRIQLAWPVCKRERGPYQTIFKHPDPYIFRPLLALKLMRQLNPESRR